jgi:hypothetical protein
MNVILTPPVEIALRTLGEEDRLRLTAWFDHLKNWEKDDYVRRRSQKLNPDEAVYVLKTNTDLRIFFRLGPDGIEVLDVARKDTILQFGDGARAGRP